MAYEIKHQGQWAPAGSYSYAYQVAPVLTYNPNPSPHQAKLPTDKEIDAFVRAIADGCHEIGKACKDGYQEVKINSNASVQWLLDAPIHVCWWLENLFST